MSLAANSPNAILETILGRLAILFLTGAAGDMDTARDAARQMLAAYKPETEDELRLAAEIITFSFQALEGLSQAAQPDASLNQTLRLRGSAVSLSRECHKSQRRLVQLQKSRQAGIPVQPVVTQTDLPEANPPTPNQPMINQAQPLTEATRASNARHGHQSWYDKRQAAHRIAANLKKNQLNVAAPAG